jgi:predicted secreted Zn-dependent protease
VLLLITGLAIPAAGAQADPVDPNLDVDAKVTYYTVQGTTWSEINAAIKDPDTQVANTGMHFEGVTYSKLSLEDQGDTPNRCSSSMAKVKVTIVIHIPRIDPRVRLSRADEAHWAAYDRGLTEHEEGHLQIAISSGEALLRQIRATRGAGMRRDGSDSRARFRRDGSTARCL